MHYAQHRAYFCFLLACLWLFSHHAAAGQVLGEREQELLDRIIASNTANMGLAESLRLGYTFSRLEGADGDDTSQMQGEYAYESDREYSHEVVDGTGQYLTYVRNANMARRATDESPRLVTVGKADNPRMLKATPGPFSGVIKALGVQELFASGKAELIALKTTDVLGRGELVVLEMKMQTPAPGGGVHELYNTISFDPSKAYLPVLVSQKLVDSNTRKVLFQGEATVSHVESYDLGGSTFYLPVEILDEQAVIGTDLIAKPTVSTRYRVDLDTVKINEDLPDELFELPIRNGDQVINLDIDVELNNPFRSDDLLVVEDDGATPAGNQSESAATSQRSGAESHAVAGAHAGANELAVVNGGKRSLFPWYLLGVGLLAFVIGGVVLFFAFFRSSGKQEEARLTETP